MAVKRTRGSVEARADATLANTSQGSMKSSHPRVRIVEKGRGMTWFSGVKVFSYYI
jgi:hypothetical protein